MNMERYTTILNYNNNNSMSKRIDLNVNNMEWYKDVILHSADLILAYPERGFECKGEWQYFAEARKSGVAGVYLKRIQDIVSEKGLPFSVHFEMNGERRMLVVSAFDDVTVKHFEIKVDKDDNGSTDISITINTHYIEHEFIIKTKD